MNLDKTTLEWCANRAAGATDGLPAVGDWLNGYRKACIHLADDFRDEANRTPAADSREDSRAAFESTLRATFVRSDAFDRDMHGDGYEHDFVDMAWIGWRAAIAHAGSDAADAVRLEWMFGHVEDFGIYPECSDDERYQMLYWKPNGNDDTIVGRTALEVVDAAIAARSTSTKT